MGTILVTGATGFLGQALVPLIAARGDTVRVLERRPGSAPAAPGVERATGDVTDPDSLAAAMAGADRVIHMAGLVSHAERDRERLMRVNVGGTEHVLAAARAAGAGRVVHVSSIAAVGTTPDPSHLLDEESPYSAQAASYPYSLSKRLGEQAALAAAAQGQDVVVANPGHVLGRGDVNGISTSHIRKIMTGARRLPLPGGITSGAGGGGADGILRVLDRGESGRRYILGAADGHLSHAELARRVLALNGTPRRMIPLPGGPTAVAGRLAQRIGIPLPVEATELDSARHWWFCSSERAMAELGYAPRPIDEALRATVEWYRERGDA
ncbi:MAG: SDR family NAD(P)-dependent oxidoreductase [Gaiellales bacterium]